MTLIRNPKIEYSQWGVHRMISIAAEASEFIACSASITESAMLAILKVCKAKDPVIVCGMFGTDNRWLHALARRNGWKVGIDNNLHAKVVIAKVGKKYKVLIGSSNIAFSKRLEFNVVLTYDTLPRDIQKLRKYLLSRVLDSKDLDKLYKAQDTDAKYFNSIPDNLEVITDERPRRKKLL